MNINKLPSQYPPNFKQNNSWRILGYDDEPSQIKRNYIRQWHESHYMPYQSIYEKEGRKSEFELQKMLSYLVKKTTTVNNEKLNKVGLQNLKTVSENIYRGAMITSDDNHKIKKLHDAGIKTIIRIEDGYGDFTRLKEECEKMGINYLCLNFDNNQTAFKTVDDVKKESLEFALYGIDLDENEAKEYVENETKLWKEDSRLFIDNFTKFIQFMQNGNVYIGCDYGIYNTDNALIFDYLFNPQTKQNKTNSFNNSKLTECAENLYLNLTENDKTKMGWAKDYEEQFSKKLNNLKNDLH